MIVVVGDALLDVDVDGRTERFAPDAPAPVLDVTAERVRPGGAGLAAALLAAAEERVALVCALEADRDGVRLRSGLGGVELVDGPGTGGTAVKTRYRADGRVLLRVDRGAGRPGAGFVAALAGRLHAVLADADAVLVSDYGRGVTADPLVRDALARTAAAVPVVWDPHPRGTPPVPGTTVVTPNAAEAAGALGPTHPAEPAAQAAALARRWACRAVAVTVGERGAVVGRRDGAAHAVAATATAAGDPCGAGDAFAARLTSGLAAGRPVDAAVEAAVRAASAFVAAGGAATFTPSAAAHRRRAGRVA